MPSRREKNLMRVKAAEAPKPAPKKRGRPKKQEVVEEQPTE